MKSNASFENGNRNSEKGFSEEATHIKPMPELEVLSDTDANPLEGENLRLLKKGIITDIDQVVPTEIRYRPDVANRQVAPTIKRELGEAMQRELQDAGNYLPSALLDDADMSMEDLESAGSLEGLAVLAEKKRRVMENVLGKTADSSQSKELNRKISALKLVEHLGTAGKDAAKNLTNRVVAKAQREERKRNAPKP